jgi:hypothetical protein
MILGGELMGWEYLSSGALLGSLVGWSSAWAYVDSGVGHLSPW